MVEAADRPGVKGVVGIIDTCTAAAAQPRTADLAIGARGGQTQLSLLMASAVDQSAYDMKMSRNLAEILRTGVPGAGGRLHMIDLITRLRATVRRQSPIRLDYDADSFSEPVWLAYNRHADIRISALGINGAGKLLAALRTLHPDRSFPQNWDTTALHGLRRDLGQEMASPAHTRAIRVVDSLVIAQTTISFLRSFMAVQLTTERLWRALVTISRPGESLTVTAGTAPITEVDAVEHAALNYPAAEGSCRAQLVRFVLALADDAGLDFDSSDLHDWAVSIGAIVAFNDGLAIRKKRRAAQRLRLIIGLQPLAGSWPEQLGAWLVYDGTPKQPEYFDCTPDRRGVENALALAMDWARTQAKTLGVSYLSPQGR